MRDGCLCACAAVQATMVNAQSGNAMRKVVRGLLALQRQASLAVEHIVRQSIRREQQVVQSVLELCCSST